MATLILKGFDMAGLYDFLRVMEWETIIDERWEKYWDQMTPMAKAFFGDLAFEHVSSPYITKVVVEDDQIELYLYDIKLKSIDIGELE